jgi:hypothetical protein
MSSPEVRLHAAAIQFLRTVRPPCLSFRIPNSELREPATGRRLKSLGVLSGAFDIVLLATGGRAFFLEAKSAKGRLSPAQEDFRLKLIAMGFNYVVFRNLGDVEKLPSHTRNSEQAGRPGEAMAVSAPAKAAHNTVDTYRPERSMADTLRSLAVRLQRLAPPSHCDPERYHLEKSELVHDLRTLARRLP